MFTRPSRRLQFTKAFAFTAVAALASVTSCGGAGSPPTTATSATPQDLTVLTSGPSALATQLYVAQADGVFAKYGLNVTLQAQPSSYTASVVSGEADLAFASPASMLAVINQGKDARAVYVNDGGGAAAVVVTSKPGITSPAECKTLSEFSVSSSAYAWAVTEEKVFNVNWTMTNFTSPPAVVAGVVSGQNDCSVGAYTVYAAGIAAGKLHVILDPSNPKTLPRNWPKGVADTVMWGLSSDLKTKKTAVQNFIKALDSTCNNDMKHLSAAEMGAKLAANPDFQGQTAASLAAGVTHSLGFLCYNKGYMPPSEWPGNLAFYENGGLTYVSPADPKWSYANTVDMSYYRAVLGTPKV